MFIHGIGHYLPERKAVADATRFRREDLRPEELRFWDVFCEAAPTDHPSGMGAAALNGALAEAGLAGNELSAIFFCGMSRDYLPSWSVSSEIARQVGAGAQCFALDITLGCAAVLAGLEVARGWLRDQETRFAAVVTAERWNETIDRNDRGSVALWSNSDGAAAAVVGVDRRAARLKYVGARFTSFPEFNGVVKIKYGGTRHPTDEEGRVRYVREFGDFSVRRLALAYREGYRRAFGEFERGMGAVRPDWVVVNQPGIKLGVSLGDFFGVAEDRIRVTGDRYGHVGAADILLGLHDLTSSEAHLGDVLMATSTPAMFGVGLAREVT